MNFDDVGRIWRDEVTGEFRRRRTEDLSSARDRAADLDAKVLRRDLRETIAALIVIPFYIRFAIRASTPISALGAIIVVITAAIVPFRLRMARRPARDLTLPVGRAVEIEVARLRAQERLLGSVLVWYLGPFGIGVILHVVGSAIVSPLFKVLYTLLVLVACGLLLVLNRRVARLKIQPLREELESWLADLEASDLDEVR